MRIRIFLIYFLVFTFYSFQLIAQKSSFVLDGKSTLTIINNSSESIHVEFENWYKIPLAYKLIDTIIHAHSLCDFNLITQAKDYVILEINSEKVEFLAVPYSIDTLKYTNHSDIDFFGNLRTVNNYLFKKNIFFEYVGSDLVQRANATRAFEKFSDIIILNDSICHSRINYLKSKRNVLPKWYVDFEIKYQHYSNSGFKANSLLYRLVGMQSKDSLSIEIIDNIRSDLSMNEPELIGNGKYFTFINSFIGLYMHLKRSIAKESGDTTFSIKDEYVKFQDEYLNKYVKGIYLSFTFGARIERMGRRFNVMQLNRIDDLKVRKILNDFYIKKSIILPKGTSIPSFQLADTREVYYKPIHFKDSILLINFWAVWCKPCIIEFPDENRLVEQYKDKPVKIINICIESDQDKWKYMVKNHNLKTTNLWANENWTRILKERFDINGIPHSILVGKDGKVVQNKCERASSGIDKQIDELLKE